MENFSNIHFDFLENPDSYSTKMKVRNVMDNIKSYRLDNENFAIHLLGCDASDFSCAFRVNGVPTKKLRERDTFNLDDRYSLKINSITIDYCDKQRFCDLSYEAYDVVNVSIVKKQNEN